MEKEKSITALNKRLSNAMERGNLDDAKNALHAGACINAKDENGWTALNRAVNKRENEIAKFLIESGADIEIKVNGLHWTPLHMAAGSSNTEMVELLVNCNAKVNEKDLFGNTALDYAVINGNAEIVERIIKAGASIETKNEALRVAAQYGKIEIAELLIANGANVNAKDPFNRATALHFALNSYSANGTNSKTNNISNTDKTKMTRFLIENNAEIDARDNEGKTALHVAILNKNKWAAGLLIENGADILINDNDGKAPLDYLIYCKEDESINEYIINAVKDRKIKEEEKRIEKALKARNNKSTLDIGRGILEKFWRR